MNYKHVLAIVTLIVTMGALPVQRSIRKKPKPIAASSFILRGGLIGWSLENGPNQTLDSSGVITSGPFNLSEVGPSPTYGTQGVTLGGSTHLTHADDAALRLDTEYTISVEYEQSVEVDGAGIVGKWQPGGTEEGGVQVVSSPFRTYHYVLGADIGCPAAEVESASATDRHIVVAWCDPSVPDLFIQVDGGTVHSASEIGYAFVPPNPGSSSPFEIGRYINSLGQSFYFQGSISRVRLWRGSSAIKDDTLRTWLYNGGNGRSDQEIAAYTG